MDVVDEFKRGCKLVGGDVEEGKRVVRCILNDEEKIVVDKDGRWVKVYASVYDGYTVDTKITVWDYLKDIATLDDELVISTENAEEPVYVRKVKTFAWEVPRVVSTPFYVHPDFMRTLVRRGAWKKIIHV